MKRRRYGNGTFTKKANGKWLLQFHYGAANPETGYKPRKAFARDTKEECLAARDEFLASVKAGTHLESATVKLREWLPASIRNHVMKKNLRTSTLERDLARADRVNNVLGNVRLIDLKENHLDQLFNSANYTRENVRRLRLLKQHCALAEKRKLLARTPFASYEMPVEPKTKEAEVLQHEQIPQYIEALKGSRVGLLFQFLLATGMRYGEAAALTWDDCFLDEEVAYIKVNKSLTRRNSGEHVVDEAKTEKSNRHIELSAMAVKVLERERESVTAERLVTDFYWHDSNLVFPSSYGSFWDANNARTYMYKRLKAAGVPKVKFHTLRHTHISHALEAGENMFTVSRRAGHASVAFTMDRYGHVLRESQGIAKGVMDAYLDA